MEKQVLKVKIYQPDAHYRVPFSYRRRFTYPIPPHSTVKGLICNILGIRDDKDRKFQKLQQGLSIGIYGTYESIVKEYMWFRNLKKESHIEKFSSSTNRILDNVPQHPGGQMPVTVDVLHNVNLIIYISHPELLNEIKSAFDNPINRGSPIHLGRSEDWLVIKENSIISIEKEVLLDIPFFSWIPSLEDVDKEFIINEESYKSYYEKINGILLKLPTYYIISEENQRIFTKYIQVKLFEMGSFIPQEFYIDKEEGLPILLAKLGV